MFLKLKSGERISLLQIVSVIPKDALLKLTLSNGKLIMLDGMNIEELEARITAAVSIASDNTRAYSKFEEFSEEVASSLRASQGTIDLVVRASEVTTRTMAGLAAQAAELQKQNDLISKTREELANVVNRLDRIINHD